MSHHEQEGCARRQRTAATLDAIADEVDSARRLIKVARMACAALAAEERSAIDELLDMIGRGLNGAAMEIRSAGVSDAA